MKNKRDRQKWIIVKTIVVVTSILNSSVFVTSKAGLLQMPSKYIYIYIYKQFNSRISFRILKTFESNISRYSFITWKKRHLLFAGKYAKISHPA